MHELSDASETSAYAAAGVQVSEVFGFPATAAADFECESVAQGEHDSRGGGGGEVEGAGFSRDAGVEEDVAGLGEGGGSAGSERDKGDGETLEGWEEAEEFVGLATVGEGNDCVASREHAHVAMHRLGGVEEVGGGAGGAEGCGDLAGDDAALADPSDDDAMLGVRRCDEVVDSAGEGAEHGFIETEG